MHVLRYIAFLFMQRSLGSSSSIPRRVSLKVLRRESHERPPTTSDLPEATLDDWKLPSAAADADASNDSNATIVEARCDFCQHTAAENKRGRPEDLLFCKDCPARGS